MGRNTVVHGVEFLDPNLVARGVMESYNEFKKIMATARDMMQENRGLPHMESSLQKINSKLIRT